ncbi:SAM hydrolase/SAM-dependent halogenase family protein [Moheibacter sp.]|uniref:SAM hydrolase/SAM-dependent halogenase family protein n=1 Tax=Moheibacter sp. TaxID=1965316 RepID=UPI003C7240AF
MSIITLTTDFGLKDPFVASVKARIYSELPDAVIVDISHGIQPFDIGEGAFIVKNSYKDFPDGTIHILGVDALVNPVKKPVAAEIDDHYFITSDNGILSLICSEVAPKEIVEINLPHVQQNSVFPTRDLFVPVACHLARGGKLSVVGQRIKEYKELSTLRPVVKDDKTIIGLVIYIDNYGNAITNISERIFDKVGKKRNFRIYHRNHEFTELYRNYSDFVKDFDNESEYLGKGMALMGSSGYLEIAIYKSNPNNFGAASTLFGLKKGSEVYVEFT